MKCKHKMLPGSVFQVALAATIALCCLSGCMRDKPLQAAGSVMFDLLSPDSTGVFFRNDVVDTLGVNPLNYLYAYNGGGVAAGDINNDGLCDLIFTSNQKGCTIYLNKGDMKFEDITAKSGLAGYDGWFTGVTLADVNADGWLDIYVCRSGPDSAKWANLLFINNHNGTFTEQAPKYNLQNGQPCTQAVFFDYDNDGDLDVYLVNHPANFTDFIFNPLVYADTSLYKYGKDRLMENVGGTFVDVSDKAGINPQLSYGLSASVTDVNNDGYPDLYVANDFFSPDHFYINSGNKTFTEKTTECFRQTSLFSMGSDFGDLNNDGYQDLMVMDMLPDNHVRMKTHFFTMPMEWYNTLHSNFPPPQFVKNSMQVSNGGKSFSEIAQYTNTAKTDWSWNVNIDDLNNDGWNDIFITRGTKRDYFEMDFMQLQDEYVHRMGFHHFPDSLVRQMPVSQLRNYLYINHGALNFSDETVPSGLTQKVISNGAVTADLDNDGALDLIVNNTDGVAFIYRNNTNRDKTKNYLRIKFEGDSLNRFGIGTVVNLYTAGTMQHKQLANSRGFESCPEQVLHFGLGTARQADSLIVKWFDGSVQTLYNVAANRVITLKKRDAVKVKAVAANVETLLTEVYPKGLNYLHKEDNFNDFKKDRLIPFMISREGPAMAVADVNNDGLQDVFIGGAYNGSKGELFIQQSNGSFVPAALQPWKDLNIETTGAVFADFNGDGYADLYLSNGSNEYNANDTLLRDRLYINNEGKGFTDVSFMLPPMAGVKTAPVAFDFDGDGDLDLFVGGRMMPGLYPSSSRSYLLRNDGNHFTDVTAAVCAPLTTIGNVTAAYAADLDADGKPDLVVAAEWLPVMFFKNTGATFKRVKTDSALDSLNGWWKCITAADLNGDGKTDFVIGNQGLNSYLRATTKEPVTLYFNDFDGNGVKEPLVLHYLHGKEGLLYDRNTLCDQMPKFRNNFLTYNEYSQAAVSDIITDAKMKTSEKYQANYFKSIWIENLGNFHFKIHELPDKVQWAPANAFIVADINGDGKPDIITGGNSESDLYWAGWSSASPGEVLLNNGRGSFSVTDINTSGYFNQLVCRHLQLIKLEGQQGTCLLAANNNNLLRIFRLK